MGLRKLSAGVALLAVAGILKAQPLVYPTQDVTVTYVRRDGKHVVVKTAKGGYPVRIEFPDQPEKDWRGRLDRGESYLVVLAPGTIPGQDEMNTVSNMFHVWNTTREFRYAQYGMDDWLGKLKLTATGKSDMIAGIMCDDWSTAGVGFMLHGKDVGPSDTVCLSENGVLLRYLTAWDTAHPGVDNGNDTNYASGAYPASMIALSVSDDPLPPDTFALPKGYRREHWAIPASAPMPSPAPSVK